MAAGYFRTTNFFKQSLQTSLLKDRPSYSRSSPKPKPPNSIWSYNTKRIFHTTRRRPVNPLFALLFKSQGIKILKGLSIIFGRSFRKLHDKLPESIQNRIGRHRILILTFAVTVPFVGYYSYTHYESCPITGRKRWITFTRDQIAVLSDLDYAKLLEEYQGKMLPESDALYQKNLELINQLVKGNMDIDFVKNTAWNLHVVDDPTVTNAFVLPNGQIFVFTGMLKMLNTWEEMAVILGHEMSHAILGHSQEQQSYLAFGEILSIPLLAFIWFFFEDFVAFLTYSIQQYVYPIIFEYGFSLPYSRLLETEADEVGLLLAAKACFDPRWSVFLWEKMALKEVIDGEGLGVEFDFLSTHPSSEKRSIVLEQKLPKVMEKRSQCNCPPLQTNVDPKVAAQVMRKCANNLKERKRLQEELKLNISILDEDDYLKKEEKDKKQNHKLQKILLESENMKTRLRELELEYQQLTNVSHAKPKVSADAEVETKYVEEKAGFLEKIRKKMIGNVSSTGKLTDTLFEKEHCKLSTVDLKKSTFGKTS